MNMVYGNSSQPLVDSNRTFFFFSYALELEQRSKIYDVIPFCKCHLIL